MSEIGDQTARKKTVATKPTQCGAFILSKKFTNAAELRLKKKSGNPPPAMEEAGICKSSDGDHGDMSERIGQMLQISVRSFNQCESVRDSTRHRVQQRVLCVRIAVICVGKQPRCKQQRRACGRLGRGGCPDAPSARAISVLLALGGAGCAYNIYIMLRPRYPRAKKR